MTERSGRARVALKLVSGGVCAASLLAFAGLALAASSFSDPTGDNNAAPDVTAVAVSESADGNLTIAATIANYQALPANSWVNLWFDLDSNGRTGDDGDEALVQYFDDGRIQFWRWNGSTLVRREAAGMTATFAAGVLTFTGPKTALDGAASFDLLAVASRGQDVGADEDLIASDTAPNNGRGRWVAPGPLSVTDLAGDHEAAPDVTDVRVSDSGSGTISFAVSTPSHAALTSATWVELDVDIDRRHSTGGGGVEVYVVLTQGRVFVGRWSPSEQEFAVRRTGARARSSGGVVTFDVPRALLEDVASFDFYVVSGDSETDDEDNAIDLAPDGDRWWRYTLANKPPLRLIAEDARGLPARPRAGRTFSVVVPVRRSDTARGITSGSATCTVQVAGKPVQATGKVGAGNGRCSLRVPAGSRGTALRGSIVVRSGGKAVTTRFSFPVR